MNEKLVSFAATIAYGWLSLALLVIAALWMGSPYAVMCGLLACGAAYIAQLIYTQPEGIWEVRIGAAFQILSLARSEEHTSELQSLMRISYAVFCLKKKKT